MFLYMQTRVQTADQTLLPLHQTQSDAGRAVQPALPSAVPAAYRKTAASCIS